MAPSQRPPACEPPRVVQFASDSAKRWRASELPSLGDATGRRSPRYVPSMPSAPTHANLRQLFSRLVLGMLAPLGTASCSGSDNHSAACAPVLKSNTCVLAMVTFPCGFDGEDGGALPLATCDAVCGTEPVPPPSCSLSSPISIPAGGAATILCDRQCTTAGRRPRGLLRPHRTTSRGPVGEWLAFSAHLEAASIPAFERLATDLAQLGAPRALIGRACSAARDEARHARVMTRLARQRGATVPRVVVRPVRPASLARLAAENAAEGCVRETYGALVATWQAAHACDPAIRASMARIASDETRHAALAWSLHAWVSQRLTRSERRIVDRVRAAALESLRSEATHPPHPDTEREAGLPPAHVARALWLSLQALVITGARDS
jgi:hypothetical protein